MIVKVKVEKNLTELEKEYYQKLFNKHTVTGERIRLVFDNGCEAVYIVLKGDYTPVVSVRDCGGYWIYGCFSGYIKIDKNEFSIEYNVEDK